MSKDGGPAFPHFRTQPDGLVQVLPQGGMTLRDYFAAKALQGFVASPEYVDASIDDVVADCYSYADAMLKAREK